VFIVLSFNNKHLYVTFYIASYITVFYRHMCVEYKINSSAYTFCNSPLNFTHANILSYSKWNTFACIFCQNKSTAFLVIYVFAEQFLSESLSHLVRQSMRVSRQQRKHTLINVPLCSSSDANDEHDSIIMHK